MDTEILAALQEFLLLSRMNLRDRSPIEAAFRARALQEISQLDTDTLTRVARRVASRSSPSPAG